MEALTVFLLGFLAVGGFVGGLLMVADPSGAKLGMSTDLLQRSPVHTYFWPGVFLLCVMALWPIINIILLATDNGQARLSIILLGAACMAWIVYQLLIIRQFWFLQPVIFAVGILLIVTQI